jgi:hypothetical protein
MTLIANFAFASYPILLGDLMVSLWQANPPDYRPFHIPTMDNVNSLLPREWGVTICGLTQKLVRIDDRLGLGWSGSEIAARAAIRELVDRSKECPLTINSLKDVLDGLDLGSGLDLVVTGLLLNPRESGSVVVTRFSWDYSRKQMVAPTKIPGLGDVYLTGTGAPAFLDFCDDLTHHMKSSTGGMPRSHARAFASAVGAFLAGQQMRMAAGVWEQFGGGFEVITVDAGRITKVGDTTHFFMDVSFGENSALRIQLRRALRFSYLEDLLLIDSLVLAVALEVANDDMGGLLEYDPTSCAQALYVVSPPHRSPTAEEVTQCEARGPLGSFGSQLCAYYVYLPSTNRVETLVHYLGNDGESQMILTVEGNEVTFKLTEGFVSKLRSLL